MIKKGIRLWTQGVWKKQENLMGTQNVRGFGSNGGTTASYVLKHESLPDIPLKSESSRVGGLLPFWPALK